MFFLKHFQTFFLKTILIVGILLFQMHKCKAQSGFKDTTTSRFEFGASFQLNYPRFSHGNPLDFLVSPTGARTRIGLKGTARYYPLRRFYTEFQLHYSPEGGGYSRIRKTNVNYLNSNLLFGFATLEKRRVRLDIHLGYSVGYLINARYKDEQTATNKNVSAYFTSWKTASILGVGIKIKASENNLINLNVDSFSSLKSVLKTPPVVHQLITPAISIGVSHKFQ